MTQYIQSQILLYIYPVLNNQALTMDDLSINWNNLHVYTFLLSNIISSTLAKSVNIGAE